MKEAFERDGFVVLKGCVPIELRHAAQRETLQAILGCAPGAPNTRDLAGCLRHACARYHQADVQQAIHQVLQAKGLKRAMLLQRAVHEFIVACLGQDLEYNRDGAVAINIKATRDNLYMKAMHQEMWSGAGLELRIWVPLMMPGGGMRFVPGSHLWGLIPNRKRKPLNAPKAKTIVPDVGEGDAVLFHSLTLHATEPNTTGKPRVAITMGVRNLYHPRTGHEHLQSWQPYHLSPMGKIQKLLGNPHLSPYRTLGAPTGHRTKAAPEMLE